jgi:hypothetical protein
MQNNWYTNQFPEALYPCRPELLNEYIDKIYRGMDICRTSSVCVLCVGALADYQRLYGYNRLQCVAKTFQSSTIENINESTKIEGINDTLQYLREGINRFDFIIIADLAACGGWSYEGIYNSIGWSEVWDACGSNGLRYEDTSEGLQPIFYDTENFRKLNHWEPHKIEDIRSIRYNRGEPPIRTFSCFGGLIIYKKDCIYGNKFKFDGAGIMGFNRWLVHDGHSIWLNPSMISLYSPTDYSI